MTAAARPPQNGPSPEHDGSQEDHLPQVRCRIEVGAPHPFATGQVVG